MKSPDLRDFGLSPRMCGKVQKALQPGEQVRWAGQPVIRHFETDRANRGHGFELFKIERAYLCRMYHASILGDGNECA